VIFIFLNGNISLIYALVKTDITVQEYKAEKRFDMSLYYRTGMSLGEGLSAIPRRD